MLLTGTYPRALDEKGRLALPARLREQLKEPTVLIVSPAPDKSLWVNTESEFERLAGRIDEAPTFDSEARVFRRLFFAQAETVEVDKSGRILIPDRLAQFATLTKEIVLIGVRDHLELWDANRWQQFVNEHAERFDNVAEKAFEK